MKKKYFVKTLGDETKPWRGSPIYQITSNEAFGLSIGESFDLKENAQAKCDEMNQRANCPLCGEIMTWIPTNKLYKVNKDTTHIYICPACPFVGFEFYSGRNIEDLKNYLNREALNI